MARSTIFSTTAFFLVIFGFVGMYIWKHEHRLPVFEMFVFPLKTGRSLFLRTPSDTRILIDGGSNSEVIRYITRIVPFYSRRIDAIFITTTDSKNIAGLIDIIQRYSVHDIYIPKYRSISNDKTYDIFIETITSLGISIHELEQGDSLDLNTLTSLRKNKEKEVKMNVLFPAPPDVFEYSKASLPELLMSFTYENNLVVFMGNATSKVQKYITASTTRKKSDVAIVSHGATVSTITEDFINTFQPTSIVYARTLQKSKKKDVKEIKIGDPLAGILNENRFNIREKGMVKIISDGADLKIN
ncbi:MAG: hypothetical protein M3Q80_00580, partial [bacterium]|nr:hypothetical protein [bacterium]